MIDTIKLYGEAFEVVDWSKLKNSSDLDRSTGELVAKDYQNTGKVSATIRGPMLSVRMSLPKLIHGTSLIEVREKEAGQAVESIQKELLDGCGIKVFDGLTGLNISRLDYCRNLKVDHNINEYIGTLEKMTYPRRDTIRNLNTLYFRNNSRELCFYNKVKEVRQKSKSGKCKDVELYDRVKDLPETILRVEAKLRRLSVVKKDFSGLSLYSAISEERSRKKLSEEYSQLIGLDTDQYSFDYQGNLDLVNKLKARRSRAVAKFFEVKGSTQFLMEVNYDWGLAFEFLRDVSGRSSAYNWIRKLKSNERIARGERDRCLLSELKRKIEYREVA